MRKSFPILILAAAVIFGFLFWAVRSVQNDGGAPAVKATEGPAPFELATQTVTFSDGTSEEFRLASNFAVSIAAENLGKARFLAMSPDGRLFVPDMINFNYSREGKIYILDDWNSETRRFESTSTYLTGLKNPNSLAFYRDAQGRDWLYIALTDGLIRYPYAAGDQRPSGPAETIATFPDYRTIDGDVWHITRTILFRGDELYVSVGSSCNICEERPDEVRAMIVVMDPEGNNLRVYAEGLRNAVGLSWAKDALYATVNGVDHHGAGSPDDLMHRIEEGRNYGFPYCYESEGEILEESRQWVREPLDCSEVPLSLVSFGPHTAPLGLTYFAEAHPVLQNSFLAALHGSFRIEIGNGYGIVRVTEDGRQEIFMDGFLKADGSRVGRPVHVLQKDQNSFFFTDDLQGRLYYVYANWVKDEI